MAVRVILGTCREMLFFQKTLSGTKITFNILPVASQLRGHRVQSHLTNLLNADSSLLKTIC